MRRTDRIITALMDAKDEKYAEFQRRIITSTPPERIIGVRTPALRAMAKELSKAADREQFLAELPHKYFEEDQLHSFTVCTEKDFDKCICEVDRFLPYVDNWATCDQLAPKVFAKHRTELLPHIRRWLASEREYTVRFGIEMLMSHFLDDDFSVEYASLVAAVRREEYYVRMMAAWYFATALAKHYEDVLPFITERRLDEWTHNKTIQKAVESYRITAEQKEYLKSLKIK